ncbi:MAG TPA: hypothetical protein VFL27_11670 [Candidatus Dormibacteraeota bacterium]|nr:hypothetical protein [Candidatus Dormibacteraeota bacterium]
MNDLGSATEDQVILAWLQAEIESPDFQAYVVGNPPNPANLSLALKAARSPDLRDQTQNDLRRQIITEMYGFGQGRGSFEGLGGDLTWRRVGLTVPEVAEMLYARRDGAWRLLSPATRKVAEGATNVGHVFTGDNTNMVVLSLASGICHSDKKVPEIIALKGPDGALVILEGHARATAIVLEAHRFPNGVHAYVGEGPSVAGWPYL